MSFSERLRALRQKLPEREQIFASRWTKPLAPWFDKPYFWHLGRRNVALAVAIGLFCGLMPGPTQMLSALVAAYFLRAHLPVAVFTTLYSNPFTYLPLYYVAYELGRNVLGLPPQPFELPQWQQWRQEMALWLSVYGKPLLVGVPLLGSLFAVTGYVLVRLVWAGWVIRRRRGDPVAARALTDGEARLVSIVFRDGVNTDTVRVHCGAWWLPERGTAVSFGGRIYFPRRHYCADFSSSPWSAQHWFIHEMTHVWQAQQGFPVLAAGVWLWLRGGYWRRRAYRYTHHCVAGGFARMNMEQQADVLADYFLQMQRTGQSELAAVLCDFLRAPRGKGVLPRFW